MGQQTIEIQKLQSKIKLFTTIAWLLIGAGIIILFFSLWIYYYDPTMTLSELGDFLAGSMTAAWSLAALFFIYIAFLGQKQQMIYQQQELRLNRDDLDLNRQEIKQTNETLKLQRQEMAKQNETAERHQFETLFFNMIDTHLKIVADLDVIVRGEGQFTGRDVFVRCVQKELGGVSDGKAKIDAYKKAYKKYSAEFGHYYRFLYRIISRIDEQQFISKSKFDPMDNPERDYSLYNFEIRYEYTSIVRSLLSDEELEMLFYNMLLYKDLKFKALIEKYCLLKSIPEGQSKIDNPEYDFDAGAIKKDLNSNFKELYKLKQE